MTASTVTTLLVSHDGERWLPQVLAGIAASTRPVDRLLVVDTGSEDRSADIARSAGHTLLELSAATPFGEAIRAGLSHLAPQGDDHDEWIWILHDDSNPAPDALAKLLQTATSDPGIAAVGPKLREWPSLRRLLELGVTISGTGRRETGLERGEYDQGQHDRKRDVLAVNTAGMLVRRSVLEHIGFDPRLPVFGNDVDFGWRAARAGHRIVVEPEAVVFHVEAAHRGVRRTPLTGSRYHRVEREAALYTLLVNSSSRGLPWRLTRLFLGSLLRMLGFLLVRSPGEAWDEFGALVATYLRPSRVMRGRRDRRRTSTVGHADVKHLLAGWWVPYRHGLDFVSDVASAVVNQAADLAGARQQRVLAETGPIDEESDNLEADTGLVARLVTNPIAWTFLGLIVLAVVAGRGRFGDGHLWGGALLAAPDTVAHWWSTLFAGSHSFGVVSTAPAAPALLPLALAGTILFGKAWLVVDLIVLFAVPLAAWGGFRFVRRVTGVWSIALWAGVSYGLLAVLSGSAQQGRIGTLVVLVVLPWLAHSALFLFPAYHQAPASNPDRAWRATFRTALWLALAACFAPLLLVLAGAVTLTAFAVWGITDRALFRAVWRYLMVLLVVAVVLLLPWAALMWSNHGGADWLFEFGRPASELIGARDAWDLALGRPGAVGSAPPWLSAVLMIAAIAALLRRDTRRRVVACWWVIVVAFAAAGMLNGLRLVEATTGVDELVWSGVPLLIAQAAAILAVAIAATGLREVMASHAFGWRQLTSAALILAVAVSTLLGLGWWAVQGTGDPEQGLVDRRAVTAVPRYMTDAAETDPGQGVLVIRGDQRAGFRYQVLRERGLRLGDDSVLPTAVEQEPLTRLVGALAASPDGTDVDRLAGLGVRFVYAPPPVDSQLAGNLDVTDGLERASAPAPGSRGWQLAGPGTGPERPERVWYSAWVGLQCLAVVIVLVLAAPTRRRQR